MKVSDITTELVANYIKEDFANMTDAEKAELDMLIDTAKTFIRGQTGIKEQTVTGEVVGYGDGETKTFKTALPHIPGTSMIYVDGAAMTEATDYTLDDTTGDIVMDAAPDSGVKITADYQTGLDAYNDFVIAVYVLTQDMHDNRAMYVDKNNVNRVVDAILTMHSINLL